MANSNYHKEYYVKNKKRIQERAKNYFSNPEVKLKRKEYDSKPENAVRKKEYMSRYQIEHWQQNHILFLKKSLKGIKEWPKKYPFNLDLDYLIELYKKQDGKCALSKLDMEHKFKSLYSISIDQIEPGLGHVKGNVQLVCKFFNLGKNKHTNEEVKELISKLKI